jgi:hypothetical protein
VRECLLTDIMGKALFSNPKDFLCQPNGRERLKASIGYVSKIVARLLSAYAKRRYSEPKEDVDYKKDLKNKEHIASVRQEIVPAYQINLDGGNAQSFETKWGKTKRIKS